MIKGINLGSGKNWHNDGWISLDEIDGVYLDSNSVLPAADNSVENIYSCHFFEHVDDNTSINLFNECYRVLKDGGFMRIVVPDTQKIIDNMLLNDYFWFSNVVGFSGRPEWGTHGIERNPANFALHLIGNFDFEYEGGFYRGPPKLETLEVFKRAQKENIADFCEWVFDNVPKDPRVKTQHINWWNFDKFNEMLKSAGFEFVTESQYMETRSADMNQNKKFDDEKPNRRGWSLYIEAQKRIGDIK